MNNLSVSCKHNSDSTAVAALLQDSGHVLEELEMSLDIGPMGHLNVEERISKSAGVCKQVAGEMLASLDGNMHLKRLQIKCFTFRRTNDFGSDMLLCDI